MGLLERSVPRAWRRGISANASAESCGVLLPICEYEITLPSEGRFSLLGRIHRPIGTPSRPVITELKRMLKPCCAAVNRVAGEECVGHVDSAA